MESLFLLRFLVTESASETANVKIQRAGHKVTVECMEQVTTADLERWASEGIDITCGALGNNRQQEK